MKIVVTNNQDFSREQKQRLESLGDVSYYDALPQSGEEYLERVKGADIICSGRAGFVEAAPYLENVYITVGFVNVSFVDATMLAANGVTLSNAPGANRHAVSEWIMFMALYMSRQFGSFLNSTEHFRENGNLPPITQGLADTNITILGNGKIGKLAGELAKAFEMKVTHFKRGDDLLASVQNADLVVDVLSTNSSTKNLLSTEFFGGMKQGSHFITVTGPEIVDYNALIQALDRGKIADAASDCGNILVGDTSDPLYKKLLSHPKIHVTPHISYNSEKARKTGADTMIDNVEAYISGHPQNVVNR